MLCWRGHAPHLDAIGIDLPDLREPFRKRRSKLLSGVAIELVVARRIIMLEPAHAATPSLASHGYRGPVTTAIHELRIVIIVDERQDQSRICQAPPHARALRPVDDGLALLIGIRELEQLRRRNVDHHDPDCLELGFGRHDRRQQRHEQLTVRPFAHHHTCAHRAATAAAAEGGR